MTRKSTGKRLRFEVLKRDGFRCTYCGVSATGSLLHVDHVVPVAEGGPTVAENLVTACVSCNGGKAAVPLDQSRLPEQQTTEQMREHAAQIKAYLAAVKAVGDARRKLHDYVIEQWSDITGFGDMPSSLRASVPGFVDRLGVPMVIEAMEATARKGLSSEYQHIRYFCAVARNMRERLEEARA